MKELKDLTREREMIQRAIHLEYRHILRKTTISTMERAHLHIFNRKLDCTSCPYMDICAAFPMLADYMQDHVAELEGVYKYVRG